jgi:periplasmic protein TonB
LIKAPLAAAQSTRANMDSAPMMMGIAARHAVDPQQIYHVGGDVMPPKLVFAPDPKYTEKARLAKYQGVCVISTVVDAHGNPTQVQIVRQLGMGLDQQAVEAVKQYKFEPGTRLGTPVAVKVNIEVNFRLN